MKNEGACGKAGVASCLKESNKRSFAGCRESAEGWLEGLRGGAKRLPIGLWFFEHLTVRGSQKPYVGCLEGAGRRAWVVWNYPEMGFLVAFSSKLRANSAFLRAKFRFLAAVETGMWDGFGKCEDLVRSAGQGPSDIGS